MAKKPEKFTVKQVEKALLASHGLRAEAARKLKCAASTITHFIQRHPELEKTIEQAVEADLDLAESKLFEHIGKGNIPALLFYLKCKGKHRGYFEKDKGITLDTFRRALERLAVVVAENVKDEETLDKIERGWESIRVA